MHAMLACLQLTLSRAPFSAKYLAIIFMLRPHMAANMIGNKVGPFYISAFAHCIMRKELTSCMAAWTLVAKELPSTGLPLSVAAAIASTISGKWLEMYHLVLTYV